MAGADILSQDEIDALLAGVELDEEEQPWPEAPAAQAARPYDFASQDRIVRGRMPALELVNERLARALGVSLFSLLQRPARVEAGPVELRKFGEHMQRLQGPCSLDLLKVRPLHGTALLVLDQPLVLSLVDAFFGGDGRVAPSPRRALSAGEQRIAAKLTQRVLDDLREAWRPVCELAFERVGSETQPQLASVLSPGEVLVLSSFTVEFDGGAGALQLLLPYGMLEPLRERLNAGIQSAFQASDPCWRGAMFERVQEAPVELRCALGEIRLSLRQVLALHPGQTLPLDMPERVAGRVEGVPVLQALPGRSGGHRALQVLACPDAGACP